MTLKSVLNKIRNLDTGLTNIQIVFVGFLLAIFIVVLTICLIVSSNSTYKMQQAESESVLIYQQLAEIDIEETQENSDIIDIAQLPELGLRKTELKREFGNVYTRTFEAYDIMTQETIKLSDGRLPLDTIKSVLTDSINSTNHKVLAIGLVGDTFYIQQSLAEEFEGEAVVGILSLNDNFSTDDWFSLTEAVFNSNNVVADNLFTYQTTTGNKHFIYVAMNKKQIEDNEPVENKEETDETETNEVEEAEDTNSNTEN